MNELPPVNFKPVWEMLRLGRHISARDGEMYHTLCSRGGELKQMLSQLGYQLVQHPRGFYYLAGDADSPLNPKRLTRIVTFGAVLIEALSNEGNVEEWLFPPDGRAHAVENLPVFNSDRHRNLLGQLDIRTKDDVAAILREMVRFGFVIETDRHDFIFIEPFCRILDACIEAHKIGEAGLADLANKAQPATEDEESD
jgi:hypothetical protein